MEETNPKPLARFRNTHVENFENAIMPTNAHAWQFGAAEQLTAPEELSADMAAPLAQHLQSQILLMIGLTARRGVGPRREGGMGGRHEDGAGWAGWEFRKESAERGTVPGVGRGVV